MSRRPLDVGELAASWAAEQPGHRVAVLAAEIEYLVRDSTATLLVTGPDPVQLPRLPAVRRVIRVRGAADKYEAWLDSGRAALDRADLDRLAGPGRRAERPVDLDSCFLQLYTPGTTGRPKGVLLTHRGVLGARAAVDPLTGGRPGDSWLVAMPLSHIGGQACALAALYLGARVVLAGGAGCDVAGLLERERITHTYLSATALAALGARPDATSRDFGALRPLWCGGCAMSRSALVRCCLGLFPNALAHDYGMTEACGVATVLGPGERLGDGHRLWSAGRRIAGVELEVCDPNTGAPLPVRPARRGMDPLRAPALYPRYWRR